MTTRFGGANNLSSTLRTRLIVASVLTALVALIAANTLAYVSLKQTLISRVDTSLRRVALPNTNGGPRFPSSFYFADLDRTGAISDEVLATDEKGRRTRPQLPRMLDLTGTSSEPTAPARFLTVPAQGSDSSFRVKASLFRDGRVLILAATLDDTENTLARTLRQEIIITLIVSALIALTAVFGVRRTLRPLTQLQHTAAAITSGDRQARTVPSGARDVQELAATFNNMVDHLENAIENERASAAVTRQFVDDAAHELRTPTTAVLAYAQLLDDKQQRSAEERAGIIRGLLTESERLKLLIDQLLALARNDDRATLRQHEPVDLVGIAAQAVDASLLVGPSWPIDLDTPEHAWLHGSATELRQTLDNLLANIRTHTPPGTPGRVRITWNDAESVTITVEDDGPGVAVAHVDHMFDRFWRSDESRARKSVGTGLGLSIVQAIVAAHHGTLHATSGPERGVKITIQLPASRLSSAPLSSGGRDSLFGIREQGSVNGV